MGPQGQVSQLRLPLLGLMPVGKGHEEKQGLAYGCAQAGPRPEQGAEGPGGEHGCLNIKQGCLVSHAGDFLMPPRAPRWVPLGEGVTTALLCDHHKN